MTDWRQTVAVVGGGAAGYFGAIACAAANPRLRVVLYEGTRRPLTKVRISGGGRCNVTHHCFDPKQLVQGYPRGHKELLGPFNRFQPRDVVRWFEERGIALKAEADGRMFPTTDDSETIAGCLERAATEARVEVRLGVIIRDLQAAADGGFKLDARGKEERAAAVLLTTGSGPQGHSFIVKLGHTLIPPVPSLFTLNIEDPRLRDLAGVSFPKVRLTLRPDGTEKKPFSQVGPLLITHWGLSGPAVLKLSTWAARDLHASGYRARLTVNFLDDLTPESLTDSLRQFKQRHPRRQIATETPVDLPKRYWQRLVQLTVGDQSLTWADVTKEVLGQLVDQITSAAFQVDGKSTYKEEFVTAGGVSLSEVDFRTLESRRCPGLYFAGEVLDIDGITGGFNFQSAWTTSWIAGRSIAEDASR